MGIVWVKQYKIADFIKPPLRTYPTDSMTNKTIVFAIIEKNSRLQDLWHLLLISKTVVTYSVVTFSVEFVTFTVDVWHLVSSLRRLVAIVTFSVSCDI